MNISNESVEQIQKDIEQLASNISNLFKRSLSSQNQSSPESEKLCSERSESYRESSENILYRTRCYVQHRPLLCLGVMALIGGVIGAGIYRKNHKCS